MHVEVSIQTEMKLVRVSMIRRDVAKRAWHKP